MTPVRNRLTTSLVAIVVVGGVLAVPGAATAAPNLVVNGSFEMPDIPSGTAATIPAIPGWTHAPRPGTTSTGIELQDNVVGAPAPGAGDQVTELDTDGPSLISQSVATSPGSTYRLRFIYSPRPRTAAVENHFTASAGSASTTIGPLAGGALTSWHPATVTFVATATSSTISFLDLGPEQATGGLGAFVDDVVTELVNSPPDCSTVTPSLVSLWPPNHKLHTVTLAGAGDPDGDPVTLTITGVTQDEPVSGTGSGDTAPDAVAGSTPDSVQLRAERAGLGDGRVYRIAFTATDPSGASCTGTATVSVPHDQSGPAAVDSGAVFDSFGV